MTRVLEQARATVERDAQLALYKRSQELVVQDYPSIYVANPLHRIAFRDYVKGYRYVGLLGYDVAFYDLTIEKKKRRRRGVAPGAAPALSCASSFSAGSSRSSRPSSACWC